MGNAGNKLVSLGQTIFDSITHDAGHVELGHQQMQQHWGEEVPEKDNLYPGWKRTGLKNDDQQEEESSEPRVGKPGGTYSTLEKKEDFN